MRHHHIPEFLLKAWADTSSDRKVEAFRLDIEELPSKRWAPKAVGYERDLYALTKPSIAGVDRQVVETEFLKQLDDSAANVLRKLTTTGFSDLTEQDRVGWSCFVTSLISRTPEAVTLIQEVGKAHIIASLADKPEEYEALADASDPPTLTNWFETHVPGFIENFGKLSLPAFITSPKLAEDLLHMKWMLWDFSGQKNHLLLSDRPCITTTGKDDSNFLLSLPIGPWTAFMAIKTERVANIIRNCDPRTLLMRMNESAVNNASKRVYGCDASPRRFILNRLRPSRYSAPPA